MISVVAPRIFKILIHVLLPLVVAGLYFYFVQRHVPFRDIFEFDRDEGINLMKAALYADGQPLYTKIWSDQPPVLTVVLAKYFKIAGLDVMKARLLILGFASLLIWAFYNCIRVTAGTVAALFGTLLLVMTHEFVRLSVSVMVGLPALALAMTAIYLLLLYPRYPSLLLVGGSGVLFAISLLTKLFTAFLIPFLLLLLILFGIQRWKGVLAAVTPLLTWVLALAAAMALIAWRCNALDYRQLVGTHIKSGVKGAQDAESTKMLADMEKHDYGDYKALAVLGLIATLVFLNYEQAAGRDRVLPRPRPPSPRRSCRSIHRDSCPSSGWWLAISF